MVHYTVLIGECRDLDCFASLDLQDCVQDRHDQRCSQRRLSLQCREREDECERAVEGQTCIPLPPLPPLPLLAVLARHPIVKRICLRLGYG